MLKNLSKDVKNYNTTTDLFDQIFSDVFYPRIKGSSAPYDISIKDGIYKIDVALAGFSKDQITVKILQDKILQIVAEMNEVDEKNDTKFIHKKLSFSTKELRFNIEKDSEVHDVTFENGLLTVFVTPPNKTLKNKSNEKLITIS